MIERFFLDRIDGQPAGAAGGFGHQFVAHPPPDETGSPFAVRNVAVPRAEGAFDHPVLLQVPVSCRFHNGSLTLFIFKRIH